MEGGGICMDMSAPHSQMLVIYLHSDVLARLYVSSNGC